MDREPLEGIDYYMEDGLLVFTAQYLRDRGYCCTSGCRHCPYGFQRDAEPGAASRDNPDQKGGEAT
jgi:hypothetical protein